MTYRGSALVVALLALPASPVTADVLRELSADELESAVRDEVDSVTNATKSGPNMSPAESTLIVRYCQEWKEADDKSEAAEAKLRDPDYVKKRMRDSNVPEEEREAYTAKLHVLFQVLRDTRPERKRACSEGLTQAKQVREGTKRDVAKRLSAVAKTKVTFDGAEEMWAEVEDLRSTLQTLYWDEAPDATKVDALRKRLDQVDEKKMFEQNQLVARAVHERLIRNLVSVDAVRATKDKALVFTRSVCTGSFFAQVMSGFSGAYEIIDEYGDFTELRCRDRKGRNKMSAPINVE